MRLSYKVKHVTEKLEERVLVCESSSSKPTDEINCSSCGDTNVKYKEHVSEEDKTCYWCEQCALTLHDNPDEVFEEVNER